MKKSYLKTRLRNKAAARVQKDWEELYAYLNNHPIAKQLVFKQRQGVKFIDVPLTQKGYNGKALVPEYQSNIVISSNIDEVKRKLTDRYEEEETDNVLSKLDNINYLIEGR